MNLQNWKLMTPKAAAEYLGLSLAYLHKLMMHRVITMFKLGGKVCFFDQANLDAYMQSVRISSQAKIDEAAVKYLVGRKTNK